MGTGPKRGLQDHNLNKLGRGPQVMLHAKYGFIKGFYLKFHSKNLLLINSPFEQQLATTDWYQLNGHMRIMYVMFGQKVHSESTFK